MGSWDDRDDPTERMPAATGPGRVDPDRTQKVPRVVPSILERDGEMPPPQPLPGTMVPDLALPESTDPDLKGQHHTDPAPALPHHDTTKVPALIATESGHGDTVDGDALPEMPKTDGASDRGTAPSGTDDVLAPDDLLGPYRIRRWLGTGGMGEVYEAEHVFIGRRVALKVLRKEASQSDEKMQRFFDEARIVNRVRHPHIVDVTDLVYQTDLPPFIVMELLKGHDLEAEIGRWAPMKPSRVIAIGQQLASALLALHNEGIIHRDLKPANVFLVGGSKDPPDIRLIDFGLAKVQTRDSTINHAETRFGTILGTVDYMAPEQAIGEPSDPRADVFALGLVLYEMATGERPYKAKSIAELLLEYAQRRLTGQRVKPKALRSLVLECLTVDRDQRPNMTVVSAALHKMSS